MANWENEIERQEYDIDTLFEMFYSWYEETEPTFDTTFVDSLFDQHENGIEFSDNQVSAFENIIYNWGINVWHEKRN